MDLLNRISIDPQIISGKPCIRGMRVTVTNILRLLSTGESRENVLKAYPYLESADIDACLLYKAEAWKNL